MSSCSPPNQQQNFPWTALVELPQQQQSNSLAPTEGTSTLFGNFLYFKADKQLGTDHIAVDARLFAVFGGGQRGGEVAAAAQVEAVTMWQCHAFLHDLRPQCIEASRYADLVRAILCSPSSQIKTSQEEAGDKHPRGVGGGAPSFSIFPQPLRPDTRVARLDMRLAAKSGRASVVLATLHFTLSSELEHSSPPSVELMRSLANTVAEFDDASSRLHTALAQLAAAELIRDKAVQAVAEREETLLSGFCAILNEKKARVRDLTQQLGEAEARCAELEAAVIERDSYIAALEEQAQSLRKELIGARAIDNEREGAVKGSGDVVPSRSVLVSRPSVVVLGSKDGPKQPQNEDDGEGAIPTDDEQEGEEGDGGEEGGEGVFGSLFLSKQQLEEGSGNGTAVGRKRGRTSTEDLLNMAL